MFKRKIPDSSPEENVQFQMLEANRSLRAINRQMLDALRLSKKAHLDEWLYQTGQFCRPAREYPEQGTVHGGGHEAIGIINAAIAAATGEQP